MFCFFLLLSLHSFVWLNVFKAEFSPERYWR